MFDNHMINRYVIVRCTEAGVHTGILENYEGKQCVLRNSRRLWYWKPKKGAFLSGVAVYGLNEESKVGVECERIHLTEACEIIQTTKAAEESIIETPNSHE